MADVDHLGRPEGESPARKRPPADWETIEREYRAGVFSIREIAKRHSLNEKSIRTRAKASGWERDLTAQVQQQTRAALARSLARTPNARAGDVRTDRQIVAEGSLTQVQVVESQRADINGALAIVNDLFAQLRLVAHGRPALEALIEEETASADDDSAAAVRRQAKRRETLDAAVSLAAHADTARTLVMALGKLVPLQLRAYGIDTMVPTDPPEDEEPVSTIDLDAFDERLRQFIEGTESSRLEPGAE